MFTHMDNPENFNHISDLKAQRNDNLKNIHKRICFGLIFITSKDDEDKIIDVVEINELSLAKSLEASEYLDIVFLEKEKFENKYKNLRLPQNCKEAILFFISETDVPVVKNYQRGVACCAYNATNNYIKNILGGSLVNEDEQWYTQNELVDSHGLPQENSFTVIQQLIEPYNLGISRIIVPIGSTRFEAYNPFILSLGCNPFFLVDGMTTNEEALDLLFQNKEDKEKYGPELLAQWKFECRKETINPSITMVQFNTMQAGHNGGSSYRAPRAVGTTENWRMCIQIDRLSNIKYQVPLNLPKYKKWEGASRYNFWQVKDGNTNITLAQIQENLRKKENKIVEKVEVIKNDLTTFFKKENKSNLNLDYPPTCETCQRDPGRLFGVDNEKFCQNCGTKQEKNYQEIDWQRMFEKSL